MSNLFTLNSDDEKAFSLKTKAFTLIELLVVIAIIGLLISILVPTLNLAKLKAASAVCLMNVKNLSLAWYMYQDDNRECIVDGNPGIDGWIQHPLLEDEVTVCDATQAYPEVTDKDEQRGIEKGLLYPYLNSVDVFHCPADFQRKSKYDFSTIFRTYAIPDCLRRKYIKKLTQIKMPSMRYNFVEESEGRNYNVGTWSFMTPLLLGPGNWEWQDPIGVNHGDSGVLGFCDGHAEVHQWQESYTIERVQYYFKHPDIYGYGTLNQLFQRLPGDEADNDADLDYMARGWAYQDW
ncbi:MAG: type II secretion system protein [Sedimentisphaerales bacterium]|nr:type II secretion system protein [Sedimentisphaerales bacterium]